jgi:hypothetical protein
MNATTKTLGLTFALAIAALGAACGPSLPPTETPSGASTATPEAGGAPSATPEAAPSAGPSAAPAASGAPAAGPVSAAGGPSGNTPLGPSKYLEDVKKIGIDLKKATELEKIALSEKKKLMPLFQKSLGYDSCSGCHVEGDYKQATRNMKIARGMWKSFVAALRDEKGNPVFCDSCHQGKAKLLNRADNDGVQKFMKSDYQDKLTRADKKDHECSTCHGEGMEMKIIEKIWKVPAK